MSKATSPASKVSTCRREGDRRKQDIPVAAERRGKVQRRRLIDPTTCEREYSVEELEFMHALDAYKRTNGRMFPTCSEILEVIRKLGYVKLAAPAIAENESNSLENSAATSA